MNAKKVNNLIIIFLLILNVLLAVLNFVEKSKYRITQEQEKSIVSLLETNGITIETEVIKGFMPLKQLDLLSYPFQNNIAYIAEILCSNSNDLKKTEEFGKIILSTDNEELSFEKTGFLFEIPRGMGKIEFTLENAKQQCDDLVKKFNRLNESLNLSFDYAQPLKDGYYTIEYRTVYNAISVYSSYVRFRVTDNGIIQVKGNFYIPHALLDEREIYSPDEALYSLMHELRNNYGANTEQIKVTKMDVVYRVEDNVTDITATLKADPFYRFYTTTRGEPFLINAYTNTIK